VFVFPGTVLPGVEASGAGAPCVPSVPDVGSSPSALTVPSPVTVFAKTMTTPPPAAPVPAVAALPGEPLPPAACTT